MCVCLHLLIVDEKLFVYIILITLIYIIIITLIILLFVDLLADDSSS